MTLCSRLSARKYPSSSGKGAALYGGRWNSKHFSALPRDFVLTEIRVPETVLVEQISRNELPRGWRTNSLIAATQDFGRRWATKRLSAVLSVPSAVLTSESNYVLNLHPSGFPTDRIPALEAVPV